MKSIEKMNKSELIAFYLEIIEEQSGSLVALRYSKALLRKLVNGQYEVTAKELRGKMYNIRKGLEKEFANQIKIDFVDYINTSKHINNKTIQTIVYDFNNRPRLFIPNRLESSTVCVNNTEINNKTKVETLKFITEAKNLILKFFSIATNKRILARLSQSIISLDVVFLFI